MNILSNAFITKLDSIEVNFHKKSRSKKNIANKYQENLSTRVANLENMESKVAAECVGEKGTTRRCYRRVFSPTYQVLRRRAAHPGPAIHPSFLYGR